ncbi:MAG: methyl-accepting chemotaxis protein [Clostridia bacterium]|nr:methyl-accepting chemotaxis protein [Clostridia bacterium]
MLKNMKIGKRLMLSFFLIIVVFIISSAVSAFSVYSVSRSLSKFYNGPFQVVKTSFDMRRAIQSAERSILWSCTTEDSAATGVRLDQAAADLEIVKDGITLLKNKFLGDMSLVTKFEATMEESRIIKEQVISLSRENQVDASIALYDSQYAPKLMEAKELLNQIAEFSQSKANEFNQDGINTRNTAFISIATLTVAILLLVLFLSTILTRSLTKPIFEIEEAAGRMAEGNLKVKIDYMAEDELGHMGEITSAMQQMASGDLNVAARETYRGDFAPVQIAIRSLIGSLNDTLMQIGQSSDQVASGANQVSSGAQALSQGATEQASSVEELAATINEISSQVRANAESAKQGSELEEDSGVKMEEGNRQMQETIAAMVEIKDKSGQIGKIIKTIEDIAFQTNILALNAAVEAARAGDAGKGFAVVADEVRNLASKSAEASKSTAALIEGSMHAVERGTKLADETAQTLSQVVESSKQVVAVVDNISQASAEQASSIAQVTQGIDQISSVVQTNSATAEESAAASEELSGQAQLLKDLLSQFRFKDTNKSRTDEYMG